MSSVTKPEFGEAIAEFLGAMKKGRPEAPQLNCRQFATAYAPSACAGFLQGQRFLGDVGLALAAAAGGLRGWR